METAIRNKDVIAVGPGLITGRTGEVCHFNVYLNNKRKEECKDFLDFHMEGPSEPIPLHCVDNCDDGSVDVSYSPVLSGEYRINIRYNGEHIDGSPFKISVSGESIRQNLLTCRVKVTGDALKVAKLRKENEVFVDIGDTAISGGLKVSISGPKNAKVALKMNHVSDTKYRVTFTPSKPGVYYLFVKIGDSHVPKSPFALLVK